MYTLISIILNFNGLILEKKREEKQNSSILYVSMSISIRKTIGEKYKTWFTFAPFLPTVLLKSQISNYFMNRDC